MDVPKTMRPGPCRLPARTRLGGLSTMDIKFGSSAGAAFAYLDVCERCRYGGDLEETGAQISFEKLRKGLMLAA